jgi:hypothetical protein
MKNAQTSQPREGSADADAFFIAHLTGASKHLSALGLP